MGLKTHFIPFHLKLCERYKQTKLRESYVSSHFFITNSGCDSPLRSPDIRKKTGCSEWNSQWQKSMKYNKNRMFGMKLVQGFVTNSDNPLLVFEERNVDWRSERVSPEVRNDKDTVIIMKTTMCSEWKWQDIRNYLEIYSSLKYCEVTCLSYSLRWSLRTS